jgi:hypothetical protein
MKRITLENAFRQILRAHYPEAARWADMVDQHAMRASFAEPRSPAEKAAHEASDLLKAAIIDGSVPLHGCLPGEICGDIGPGEITTPARIDIFGNTLHVRQGRTYRDVACAADDITALIARTVATPSAKDTAPPTDPAATCRALIEEHHDSDRSKDDIREQARAIPGFPISTFDSLWKDYASPHQKRPGVRPRSAARV